MESTNGAFFFGNSSIYLHYLPTIPRIQALDNAKPLKISTWSYFVGFYTYNTTNMCFSSTNVASKLFIFVNLKLLN